MAASRSLLLIRSKKCTHSTKMCISIVTASVASQNVEYKGVSPFMTVVKQKHLQSKSFRVHPFLWYTLPCQLNVKTELLSD